MKTFLRVGIFQILRRLVALKVIPYIFILGKFSSKIKNIPITNRYIAIDKNNAALIFSITLDMLLF